MNFETFKPETPLEEPIKPLVEEPTKPEPTEQIRCPKSRLILAIALGLIIGIGIMAYLSVTDEELSTATIEAFNYGIEYTLTVITNESIQCNRIPINYSGYAYTLYPLECMEPNKEGGE